MPVPIFHGDWSLIVRPAIQYFVNWTMNEIQLIAMAPNLRIN